MNAKEHRACPCLHTTPCAGDCSCVVMVSSKGCLRCCSYGSAEQQQAMAESLAAFIDAGWAERRPRLGKGARDE